MNLCAILFLQQCFQMNFDPSNSQFANLTLFPSETRHNVVDLTRFFGIIWNENYEHNTNLWQLWELPRTKARRKAQLPPKSSHLARFCVSRFLREYTSRVKKMRDFQKNKTITWRLHFHPFHSTNVHFYVILWPHCSTLKSAEWLATF